MRKITFVATIAFVFIAFVTPGCKKYEDGPYLSFVSKKERVVGAWKVDKVYLNDEDITTGYKQDYTNLNWLFDANGNVEQSYTLGTTPYLNQGNWELQSDEEEIKIVLNTPSGPQEMVWQILRLMQKDLRVRFITGKNNYEFRFVPL